MVIAPTLESVSAKIQSSFVERRLKPNPNVGRYAELMRVGEGLFETVILEDKVKLIGILFVHPDSELAKKDILPRIGQYHERAGSFTDFFFAGYGAYWPPGDHADKVKAIFVDGTQWMYSERAFNEFGDELESMTRWEYSGETDLILTTASYSTKERKAVLEFGQCITCCLEELIRDKAIESVPRFFESIFRFGAKDGATAYGFSDLHFVRTSGKSLLDWILSRVKLKEYYDKNKNLAIRNIAK